MRSIEKFSAGPGARFIEVEIPAVGPEDLLLKVHRASICGSDLPIYHWAGWAPGRVKPPLVFGHEFCGEVVQTGKKTRGFKRGDFVSVESHVYCGKCRQCRAKQENVCAKLEIIGVDRPGGFAEYAAVPQRCAFKHRDGKLKDVGSLLEPFGNAVYSALVEPVEGQTVLVTGLGPQGLFAAAVAKASGAKTVVAVEGSKFRRKLGLSLGAAAVVDPSHPQLLNETLKAGKAPGGFDAVLEMSGAPAAIELAMKSVRPGGRITAFGLPPRRVELDWGQDIIFKGIRIHGIMGRRVFETWKQAEALLRSGAVRLESVITHTFPMKDFEQAFAVMSAPEKNCGKVLLAP